MIQCPVTARLIVWRHHPCQWLHLILSVKMVNAPCHGTAIHLSVLDHAGIGFTILLRLSLTPCNREFGARHSHSFIESYSEYHRQVEGRTEVVVRHAFIGNDDDCHVHHIQIEAICGVERQVWIHFWRSTLVFDPFLALNSRIGQRSGVERQFASSKLGQRRSESNSISSPSSTSESDFCSAVEKLEIVECDLEKPDQIGPALENASTVICSIGASEKEVFDITGPCRIDYRATNSLIDAVTVAKVNHFILVTSLGTNKFGLPAAILKRHFIWGSSIKPLDGRTYGSRGQEP
ncbi:Protein TIC 62 [Arachis hypogaea]|nr:Protein TIC 62 [Arachis hypogaea]